MGVNDAGLLSGSARAPLSERELGRFRAQGFLIVRGLAAPERCARMLAVARFELAQRRAPLEYESELGYPGAPESRAAPGGDTVRRLLQAYGRERVFRDWAHEPALVSRVRQLLGQRVVLPLAHHNCIMTKQPRHSSDTLWHRDIRYWSYARANLISVWLALGPERPQNGGLYLLPGSHDMEFSPARLDQASFLRTDLADNRALIEDKAAVELEAGDALFFHCRLFHAADRNRSSDTKFSVVFSYRPIDNPPLPGTRSATSPEIVLD